MFLAKLRQSISNPYKLSFKSKLWKRTVIIETLKSTESCRNYVFRERHSRLMINSYVCCVKTVDNFIESIEKDSRSRLKLSKPIFIEHICDLNSTSRCFIFNIYSIHKFVVITFHSLLDCLQRKILLDLFNLVWECCLWEYFAMWSFPTQYKQMNKILIYYPQITRDEERTK